MNNIYAITESLSQKFPSYHFAIYRGLFEKYIAVESHWEIVFTIWIDRMSGYKVILDEVDFTKKDWLGRRLKSRLFHWTKYRKMWRRDYPRIIIEKLQLSLQSRKTERERLELFLQSLHIS